jgi:hypothetical protein
MKNLGYTLLSATAILAILCCGVVHGLWTDRWGAGPEPIWAAAMLERLSLTLGDWEGRSIDQDNDQPEGVTGCLIRYYTHRHTGQGVTMFLVCGRPGPVSIHSPDACYVASGFEMDTPTIFPIPSTIKGVEGEFRTACFRKIRSSGQKNLRIFWSWNATDGWSVPADPRSTFVHHPVLYKLYLIREMASEMESLHDDPCVDLMRHLLPELQETLFGNS